MSPMITTQSLSMSITKNIPIHLPSTSMATNNLSTRNMAAVILITKNHMNARNTKKKNTRNQNMIPKNQNTRSQNLYIIIQYTSHQKQDIL